jgi:hypothetical protein
MTAHVVSPHRGTGPRTILATLLLFCLCYYASAQNGDSPVTSHTSKPSPFYCSCADPLPLALANGSATVPLTPMTRMWYPGRPLKPSGFCKSLPRAGPGDACGDSIAICSKVRATHHSFIMFVVGWLPASRRLRVNSDNIGQVVTIRTTSVWARCVCKHARHVRIARSLVFIAHGQAHQQAFVDEHVQRVKSAVKRVQQDLLLFTVACRYQVSHF